MIEIGRDYPVLDRRWFYGIKFEKDIRTRRTLNIIPILWVKLKYDLILSLNPALIINILFIYLFWFSLWQRTREVVMKRSPLSCFKTFFPQEINAKFRFIYCCCSQVDFPYFPFTNVRLVFNMLQDRFQLSNIRL